MAVMDPCVMAAREAAFELAMGQARGAGEEQAAAMVTAFAQELQNQLGLKRGLTRNLSLLQVSALAHRELILHEPSGGGNEQR